MTDPRIEAAARAIFLAHPLSDKSMVDACWDLYENEATAAVEAMDKAATITTVEELDALPEGAEIASSEHVLRARFHDFASTSTGGLFYSDNIKLPARVIHYGTE